MKNPIHLLALPLIVLLIQCNPPEELQSPDYSRVSRVDSGQAVSVMLTAYSTTLLADGKDRTGLRVAVTDSASREITTASDSIRIYLEGDGKLLSASGDESVIQKDTAGREYFGCQLEEGLCHLILQAGTTEEPIRVEARSGNLQPGGHEIHTVPAGFEHLNPSPAHLPETGRSVGRMIGADISFLPQLEERGMKFFESGVTRDAVELLRDHGFNYIRLRIFVNPENEKGYSPEKGFCDLSHTLDMAERVRAAGMKLLLNFHYSDYWADPQQQNKPLAWTGLDFETLKDSLKQYTAHVIRTLEKQGTPPHMVQVGNEINHGLLWPDGHISHPDRLAALLRTGVEGVEEVNPEIPVMMHIALGGQNDEAVFWLDNMIARGVRFDIIGLSYYPRWHGTLEDLDHNLHDLTERYNKPVNVVEYSTFKQTVHDIVFTLPDDMGKGACIWEPLGRRSDLFEQSGETTDLILVYDELSNKYLQNQE